MPIRTSIALLAALAMAPEPARAQVSVNNQALDQLSPSSGAPTHHTSRSEHTPHHAPAHHPAPRAEAHPSPHSTPPRSEPTRSAAAHPEPAHPAPAHPTTLPAVLPAIPAAPPPVAVIAPVPPVPVQPVGPPPPVPVVADAPGTADKMNDGLRVTFGPSRSDLNPATAAALTAFAQLVKDQPIGIYIDGTATGAPDDPSTPRRLSLARALAARAVLINQGIPSTRIYVRALGPATGDGPPDRVDVTERRVTPSPDTEPKP